MTLIEIMVVVAILGMLMGSVGVFAFGRLKAAKIKNTKLVIHNLQEALVHFQTDSGEACPKALSELRQRKYLDKEPADSWGQPFVFICPGAHDPDGADIVSNGEDKQQGTPDDIKSWEMSFEQHG